MWLSNVVIPTNHEDCESTFLLPSCLLFLLFTSCVLASCDLHIYSLQPQPQAVCMQRIQALRKGEPDWSQHTLTEPGSQQHSNCTWRTQSEAKASTKYWGLPRAWGWLPSRSNPSVKWSVFRAVLLFITCQWLQASAGFRHCWDVLTIVPLLTALHPMQHRSCKATEWPQRITLLTDCLSWYRSSRPLQTIYSTAKNQGQDEY